MTGEAFRANTESRKEGLETVREARKEAVP